jgi:ribonuclease-3
MSDLDLFQEILGFRFNDRMLLTRALSHSSYANELGSVTGLSNERLEFLGDAVLGMVVAERIYKDHSTSPEGSLSRMRSSVVRGETLTKVAQSVQLDKFILLGKGESKSGGASKAANLAGAMEALIGAMYLDRGLEHTRSFIEHHFAKYFKLAKRTAIVVDCKTRLQEYFQSHSKNIPHYYIVEEKGPDHKKLFIVEVAVDGIILGRGEGSNKKDAEEDAAAKFLKSMDKQG